MMKPNPTFKSGGVDIEAEIFEPAGTPNGGVIVIAHGSDGMVEPWATEIRGYADALAGLGFIASIPHYFHRTKTTDDRALMELTEDPTRRDKWQAALADGVAHARTLPGIDSSRVGLLGFSLGGHLCLRLRASAKVLVEFFAPEFDGLGPVGSLTLHAQIHHGSDDDIVPFVPNAGNILRELRANGAVVDDPGTGYPDAGHGFVTRMVNGHVMGGTDAGNAKAGAEAKASTLKFFDTYL